MRAESPSQGKMKLLLSRIPLHRHSYQRILTSVVRSGLSRTTSECGAASPHDQQLQLDDSTLLTSLFRHTNSRFIDTRWRRFAACFRGYQSVDNEDKEPG